MQFSAVWTLFPGNCPGSSCWHGLTPRPASVGRSDRRSRPDCSGAGEAVVMTGLGFAMVFCRSESRNRSLIAHRLPSRTVISGGIEIGMRARTCVNHDVRATRRCPRAATQAHRSFLHAAWRPRQPGGAGILACQLAGHPCPVFPVPRGMLDHGNGRQGCRPNWQARMPAPPRPRACRRRFPRERHPCLPKVAGN